MGVDVRRAEDRPRQAARLQERGDRQAHRRPGPEGRAEEADVRARNRALEDARTLVVTAHDGTVGEMTFEKAILATGSRPIMLPGVAKSDRIIDSTGALELPGCAGEAAGRGRRLHRPRAGLGLRRAGQRGVGGRDDRRPSARRRPRPGLGAQAPPRREVRRHPDGRRRSRAGGNQERRQRHLRVSKGEQTVETFDKVLISIGRRPNTEDLGLETTKITRDGRGFVAVDGQRRTAEPKIFAIGDVAGEPMLAHKAYAEAEWPSSRSPATRPSSTRAPSPPSSSPTRRSPGAA